MKKIEEEMNDQPKHKPPHGMEPYDLGGGDDLGALSKEQQQKLNDFKVIHRRLLLIFGKLYCTALDTKYPAFLLHNCPSQVTM